MLRSTATRSIARSFYKASSARPSYSTASVVFPGTVQKQSSCNKRAQVFQSYPRPSTTARLYATKPEPPFDHRDVKSEEKSIKTPIEPHPEAVSGGSSTRHVFEHSQAAAKEDEDVMLGGIKADFKTIKETFALTEVPKESLIIGAAGILPYAATSLSTVYLAWDINHAKEFGEGYLFSPELAHQLLDMVTPIQIGYGAVIISFLGAIHWGLEYAGYGGYHSYRRYMLGVIAPVVAWPTMFMPVEYALITQFAAFTFLYFADARATVRGWFPPWYATYRFVLTFFVGASIVISLVGRGQIVSHDHSLRSPIDAVKADRDSQWVALENEEKERQKALAEADEAEEDDDSEDSEEGESEDGADDESDDKKDDEKDDKKDDKEKR